MQIKTAMLGNLLKKKYKKIVNVFKISDNK